MKQKGLVGICDVDTRAIVRHIRSKGAMNAIISSEELDEKKLAKQLAQAPGMGGLELASKVSTKEAYNYGEPSAKYKVAVLDLGTKENILRCFAERGCFLKVFPAKTPFKEIEAFGADGYFISNGPGDPAPMEYATETVKAMLGDRYATFWYLFRSSNTSTGARREYL